jgi:hypothetical protein
MTGTTLECVMREVNMMRSLHHEHIVQYIGTSFDDNTLYILLEFISGVGPCSSEYCVVVVALPHSLCMNVVCVCVCVC